MVVWGGAYRGIIMKKVKGTAVSGIKEMYAGNLMLNDKGSRYRDVSKGKVSIAFDRCSAGG